MKVEGWLNTDPDNLQFGRRIAENVYEFREFNRNSHPIIYKRMKRRENCSNDSESFEEIWERDKYWIQERICLSIYTWEYISDMCKYYYTSMGELFGYYGVESPFIIAECIFEQESGLY